MSLTLRLLRPEKGEKLIDVVQESLWEIAEDGWKTRIQEGMVPVPVTIGDKQNSLFHVYKGGQQPDNKAVFDMYEPSIQGSTLVGIKKYGGRGRFAVIKDHLLFMAFTSGIGALNFASRNVRDKLRMCYFATNDSIFTVMDPNKDYERVEVFVNAAYNFENPEDGGRVADSYGPQYSKLSPAFNSLLKLLNQKLPEQSVLCTDTHPPNRERAILK